MYLAISLLMDIFFVSSCNSLKYCFMSLLTHTFESTCRYFWVQVLGYLALQCKAWGSKRVMQSLSQPARKTPVQYYAGSSHMTPSLWTTCFWKSEAFPMLSPGPHVKLCFHYLTPSKAFFWNCLFFWHQHEWDAFPWFSFLGCLLDKAFWR